jgi:SAM-dependent methyltransferase
MASADRERWNQRYQAGDHHPLPDAWLVGHAEVLAPPYPDARALDLACGTGRHAAWLAELGYAVDASDISDVGLQLLERKLAMRQSGGRPLRITPRQVDLEAVTLTPNTYNLILDAFFLERRLVEEMIRALRQGGLLVVRTLLRRGAGDDRTPAYLLELGELRAAFAELNVLDEEEDLNEGRAGIIVRKAR